MSAMSAIPAGTELIINRAEMVEPAKNINKFWQTIFINDPPTSGAPDRISRTVIINSGRITNRESSLGRIRSDWQSLNWCKQEIDKKVSRGYTSLPELTLFTKRTFTGVDAHHNLVRSYKLHDIRGHRDAISYIDPRIPTQQVAPTHPHGCPKVEVGDYVRILRYGLSPIVPYTPTYGTVTDKGPDGYGDHDGDIKVHLADEETTHYVREWEHARPPTPVFNAAESISDLEVQMVEFITKLGELDTELTESDFTNYKNLNERLGQFETEIQSARDLHQVMRRAMTRALRWQQ